ncbi:MAG: phosphodiester glycosidase family protein [Calditrichia bacterium]
MGLPKSTIRKRLFITLINTGLLLFSSITFSGENSNRSKIIENWQPIDSINATLPQGIRLFAGQNDSLPLCAWYVSIDEKDPDIVTRVLVSDDSSDHRETVSSFANEPGVSVVVNGGYFTMNRTPADHYGLLARDGKVLYPATGTVIRNSIRYETARAAIGFTANDEIDITWASNRGDTLFSWPIPPPNRPEIPAPPFDYQNATNWNVRDAIGAGPMLITDSKINITTNEEVLFGTSIPKVHPRTAAGYTADGRLILMVVDGRQENSRGVSLEELASMMHDLQVVEALNLDGGGSTTMVINHVLINHPVGGTTEREVMSALGIFFTSGDNH